MEQRKPKDRPGQLVRKFTGDILAESFSPKIILMGGAKFPINFQSRTIAICVKE